jgi:transcriptional regulator with XRE-family HTH domain
MDAAIEVRDREVPFRNVDVHVGKRVRLRRTMLGMSQEKLGAAVGLTFQQIQKYERGANRIGASRLYEFSEILDVPISFFFDDTPQPAAAGLDEPAKTPNDILTAVPTKTGSAGEREILELVRAYYAIRSLKVRARMFELVKSIGKFQGKSAE